MRDGDNWDLGNSGEVVIFVIDDEEPCGRADGCTAPIRVKKRNES